MDCVRVFMENEDRFYFRTNNYIDDEEYDIHDDIYNYTGVECPNCNVGFQIKTKETEAECPICTETFIVEKDI